MVLENQRGFKKILRGIFSREQRQQIYTFLKSAFHFSRTVGVFLVTRIFPKTWLFHLKSVIDVRKRLDYEKFPIYLSIDSEIEWDVRAHSCAKEPDIVKWIENVFQPGDVFFDIGANVGAYSLVAAKYHQGKVKVCAFEPSFLSFVQLNKNIHLNACGQSVVPFLVALSDETALGTFNYQNLTPGGALHAYGKNAVSNDIPFDPVYQQQVMSYRLDDFIEQFKLPIPQHIKVDVDGIDYEILKGAEKILQSGKLKSLFIEINEKNPDSAQLITQFLKEKGFDLTSKRKNAAPEDDGPFAGMHNYLFVRSERSAPVSV